MCRVRLEDLAIESVTPDEGDTYAVAAKDGRGREWGVWLTIPGFDVGAVAAFAAVNKEALHWRPL